jgi:hypothetical protein
MGWDATGKVYIPLEDFWQFVQKYLPPGHEEVRFGVPKFTEADVEFDYASSTECSPDQWATPPEFLKEWDKLKEKK